MIDVYVTVSRAEYIEAQTLFMRESIRKGRRWRWPLAAVVLLPFFAVLFTAPKPLQWSLLPNALFFLLFPALVIFPIPLQRLTLRKRFEKEKANISNMHVRVDDEGYWCDVPGQGSGLSNWTAYETWLEGPTVFVVKAAFSFRMLPKRVLTAKEIDETRALLARHVPRK